MSTTKQTVKLAKAEALCAKGPDKGLRLLSRLEAPASLCRQQDKFWASTWWPHGRRPAQQTGHCPPGATSGSHRLEAAGKDQSTKMSACIPNDPHALLRSSKMPCPRPTNWQSDNRKSVLRIYGKPASASAASCRAGMGGGHHVACSGQSWGPMHF